MRFDVGRDGSVNEPDFATHAREFAENFASRVFGGRRHQRSCLRRRREDQDAQRRIRRLRPSHATAGCTQGVGCTCHKIDTASRGETETWQIYNLTGDTHPMHWHLLNVQVVKRVVVQGDADGHPVYPLRPMPGTARPPDPNEAGWKETLRMNPGEVTTVVMKFDMPFDTVPSPRVQADYGNQRRGVCVALSHP
jgi:hypothetical protein